MDGDFKKSSLAFAFGRQNRDLSRTQIHKIMTYFMGFQFANLIFLVSYDVNIDMQLSCGVPPRLAQFPFSDSAAGPEYVRRKLPGPPFPDHLTGQEINHD